MIRLKPIINERSVSVRRSIIIDKDYSSYCGFSPFPAPGFQFIAIYDYEAQNEDEISLTKNDPLLISTTFEDGWTIGKNIKNDQIGFFPITCLGIGPVEDESSKYKMKLLNFFFFFFFFFFFLIFFFFFFFIKLKKKKKKKIKKKL